MTYVKAYESPDLSITMENLDGVPWHQAPLPQWKHRCFSQTIGYRNYFDRVDRCACGAISLNSGRWLEKNARNHQRPRHWWQR